MTDKIAELLLILLGVTGFLLARGLRNHLLRQTPAAEIATKYKDPALIALLAVAGIAIVLIPCIDFLMPWLDFADLPFSRTLAWLGIGIAVLSIAILARASVDFIRYRRHYEPTAIRAGIYRYVRHPFYSALLLWVFVQFLLLQNWLATAIGIAAFIALYALRTPGDDLRWLERFGHRYLHYMEETGNILPRWGCWWRR